MDLFHARVGFRKKTKRLPERVPTLLLVSEVAMNTDELRLHFKSIPTVRSMAFFLL